MSQSGEVDTGWLEREWSPAHLDEVSRGDLELAAVSAALLTDAAQAARPAARRDRYDARIDSGSAWRRAGRRAGLR